jgi:hypothetical protein
MPRRLGPTGFASELVLVASHRPPRLRRLIVHRRLADPGASCQDPPDAA